MRILILTDHRSHTVNNSLYGISKAIAEHEQASAVFIASRGDRRNREFFDGTNIYSLYAVAYSDQFQYPAQELFHYDAVDVGIEEFDVILLRLPRPIHPDFLEVLDRDFMDGLIVNDIQGIMRTSNKAFLLELDHYTVPMALCNTFEEIRDFQNPCVLKPLESYAGKDLVKIEGTRVWEEHREMTFDDFQQKYADHPQPYLAMEYLNRVHEGDKRIIVVKGEILTSTLRFPQKNGWICNIAQGGTDLPADVDKREFQIVEYLNPILDELGIFYYGLDTLVDNTGQRVISEINTLSIGGIVPGERSSGRPLSKIFARLFINYCMEQ